MLFLSRCPERLPLGKLFRAAMGPYNMLHYDRIGCSLRAGFDQSVDYSATYCLDIYETVVLLTHTSYFSQ